MPTTLEEFTERRWPRAEFPATRRYLENAHRYPCKRHPEYVALKAAMGRESRGDPWWKHVRYFWSWHGRRWHPRRIRHFVQRARHGVGYEDVWNLDHHLARVMLRGARRLRANNITVFAAHSPELTDFIEGWSHYVESECDWRCPHVQRARELLPFIMHSLWD